MQYELSPILGDACENKPSIIGSLGDFHVTQTEDWTGDLDGPEDLIFLILQYKYLKEYKEDKNNMRCKLQVEKPIARKCLECSGDV